MITDACEQMGIKFECGMCEEPEKVKLPWEWCEECLEGERRADL